MTNNLGKSTVFKNIFSTTEPLFVDHLELLKRIKDGNSKTVIERIRGSETKDEKDKLKKRLPSICWSGKFSQRDENYFLEHSGIMCLDIDAVDKKDLQVIKDTICDNEFVLSCFVSPSGNGLKVLVKVTADKENHKGHFLALEDYYNEILNHFTSTQKNEKTYKGTASKIDPNQGEFLYVHIDKSGKDINRVCYESLDESLYYNPDSKEFFQIKEESKIDVSVQDSDLVIKKLQTWIDKNDTYHAGNRNNFIYKFASALCRYGITEYQAGGYLITQYPDFDNKELTSTLKSAYKKNSFGTAEFTEEQKNNSYYNVVINEDKPVTAFWSINDKGKVQIDAKQLLRFIEAKKYGIYRPVKGTGKWSFVQSKNMIVDIVDLIDIKRDILNYVEKKAPEPVFQELQMKNRFFENSFLNALPELEVEQVRDKDKSVFFFFDGFYYEVTPTEVLKRSYIDLDGKHIWKQQICKKQITEVVDWENNDFVKFLKNAVGSELNFENSCCSIGYGLHTYKKKRLAKMIYTCDASDGELDGMSEGGSGKNLYLECLNQVRSVAYIDGKDFDKKDKFKFQNVSDDTQVVNIDDYEGDIKELFTKVTGHFEVEKKGQDKVVIEFEQAPKIFVSSNKAPKGFSSSYTRRIQLVEFSDYYNGDRTPGDEFGDRDFFSSDWNQKDWNSFYSFMFKCAQNYLNNGLKATFDKDKLMFKQLVNGTSREFAEFVEERVFEGFRKRRELFHEFFEETNSNIKNVEFLSYLRFLAKLRGKKIVTKGTAAASIEFKFE